MNFIIDERVKHRIIGVVVLAALAVIFVPALMKKSGQHLDKDIGMRTAIPPRPSLPKVAEIDRQALFKTVKVAHVQIEKASESSKLVQIARHDNLASKSSSFETGHDFVAPISSQVQIAKVAQPPRKTPPVKTVIAAKQAPITPPKKVLASQQKQPMYSVQLAAFSQRANAQILVDSLRKKGYVGNIQKMPGKGALQYKVTVGKSPKKEQAVKLQQQLEVALRLKGFVVSGVG